MEKTIDLNKFIDIYYEFVSEKGWTKLKYELKYKLDELLGSRYTTISVNKKSKYNYCTHANTFTILKVPYKKNGKLYYLRNKCVLIICRSIYTKWSIYFNDIYIIDELTDIQLINLNLFLKKKFGKFYIDNISGETTKYFW
jgi:hypothetical protein